MAKPKVFVSHSSLDADFASRLVDDLNRAGTKAWMDSNDLGAGNFQQRISEALADCEWFLLVLTRNALASQWVRQEVDAANRLKNWGKLHDLIFVKAGNVDHEQAPALWGIYNIFDATTDYDAARDRTFRTLGLIPTTPRHAPSYRPPSNLDLDDNEDFEGEYAEEGYAEAIQSIPTDELLKIVSANKDEQRGYRALERRDYEEALADYERVIRTFPLSWDAWEGKAKALDGLGRTEEAEKVRKKSWRNLAPPDDWQ
jgi:tetratricopeptide (TPR) repeat protein